AVPPRRARPKSRPLASSLLGRRDRLRELAPAALEVHRVASGRDLRDPRDDARGPCARESRRLLRPAAGRRASAAAHLGGRDALMSEWWPSRLSSFLLFSPQTYYRLFELYNRAVWPGQLAALAAGLVVLVFLLRPSPGRSRIAAGILATG